MKHSTAYTSETRYCLNCSAAVDYHYCSVCGQETRLHVASAGEFIHEFIGHYVAIEGRLWKTLWALLFRPGFLSAEYIAGRRVRYVQPLRVYLTFSILFFALLKLIGPPVIEINTPVASQAQVGDAAKVASKSSALIQLDPDTDGIKIDALPQIEARYNAFMALPDDERIKIVGAAFFSYVPYAMFCLMPLFALYLKLLYLGSGRRFGEHLLFALHTNAFAFATFALIVIAIKLGWSVLALLLTPWLVWYLPKAMRHVYGGARWVTLLRWAVLVSAHMVSIVAAILFALSLAVLG